MTDKMASGTVRLNRRFFREDNLRGINKHQLSQDEKVSYPTLLRYLYPAEGSERKGPDGDIDTFSGEVLYAILVKGMGYSEQEAAQLPMGEVFEIVRKNGEATK